MADKRIVDILILLHITNSLKHVYLVHYASYISRNPKTIIFYRQLNRAGLVICNYCSSMTFSVAVDPGSVYIALLN